MTSLPFSAPVARDLYAPSSRRAASGGLLPSACSAADNKLIGECLGDGEHILGKFNCAACCALRGALLWRHPASGQVVSCR